MKRVGWMSAALLLSACGGRGERNYAQNDLQLVTHYLAKEYCSCRFVMEMDDAFCLGWTKQSPEVGRVEVDEQKKVVRTSALTFWSASAKFVNEREGCVLE